MNIKITKTWYPCNDLNHIYFGAIHFPNSHFYIENEHNAKMLKIKTVL